MNLQSKQFSFLKPGNTFIYKESEWVKVTLSYKTPLGFKDSSVFNAIKINSSERCFIDSTTVIKHKT